MDYERLRYDLIDYFGSATNYNPIAVIELLEVQSASNSKLEEIAIRNGFDLSDYQNTKIR